MTREEIEKRIREIRRKKSDGEVAHSLEDYLRGDFIEYISKCGLGEISDMALLVLTTDEIDFARWCS